MKTTALMIAAGLLAAGGAAAQDAQAGAATFARFCAACHGAEAQGGGPMASVLVLQPPDLTQLSARNDGTFPTARVVMRIDGRDPLVSHGSPMPIYGDFFIGEEISLKAETGQPIMTAPAVVDLVVYLQNLQQ